MLKLIYSDIYKVKFFQSSTDIDFITDFNQCGMVARYSIVEGNQKHDDRINFYGSSLDGIKNRQDQMKNEIQLGVDFIHAPSVKAGSYPVILGW